MMSKFLLLWLYVVIHISHRHNNIIIAEDCVSQKKNTNNCTTFEKIIKDGKNLLHNFTLIVDGPVQLNISLCFNNLSDLTLVGKNKGTISCSNQNAGVSFYNVTGLTIKSLVFRHCGLLLKSTGTNSSSYPPREKRTHWQYRTAVYIELCSDITIEKSAFVENYGVGLSIYDPISTVDVVECNFTANRISPPESDTFSGGGGMHVELTSCAPGIYSYERSSCDRAISEQKNVSFTISSCMFENNNSTTIEYSDGYGTLNSGFYQRFGRGGGLIFVAEANVRFTYLTLTDCVFNNNSAEWGGGMLVLFTGMSSSNNLVVHNCSFGNNTGRRGGGGVLYSCQVQLTIIV